MKKNKKKKKENKENKENSARKREWERTTKTKQRVMEAERK